MTKSHDDRDDKAPEFDPGSDISQLVADLNRSKTVIHDEPIVMQGESEGTQVDIAVQWNASYEEAIYCFTNNIRNKDGGTHLTGFRAALVRTVDAFARADWYLKNRTVPLDGDAVGEGLTAILSLRHPDPTFSNQREDELVSSEVESIVERVVAEKLGRFFDEHPSDAREIAEKAVFAVRAREAARKAREMVLRRRPQKFS